MAASMPPLPANYKPIQHFLKTAQEHEKKYPVVSYYCRMYAIQKGMEIDKTSKEANAVLFYLMDRLEEMKAALGDEEAIKSDTVGQAFVEHYALKIFAHADTEDRASRHNKNVVKSFYNSMLLFEVLNVFGPLNEDIEKYMKYARYKSTYINRCLKEGITPVPGPVTDEGEDLAVGGLSISSYMASRGQGEAGGQTPGDASDASTSQPYPGNSGYQQPPAGNSGYQQPPAGNSGYQQPPAASAGYSGYQQPAVSSPPQQPPAGSNTSFDVDWEKATKYTKFATSSLTYEDKDAAVDYLRKALNLLTTGHE